MNAHVLRFASPILFRDGRPYATETPANSLAWPWPGTIYGALRSRIGRGDPVAWQAMLSGERDFGGPTASVIGSRTALGDLRLRGPLLRAQPSDWPAPQLAVPAPSDCELFDQGGRRAVVAVAADRVSAHEGSGAGARGSARWGALPARIGSETVRLAWLNAARPESAKGKPVTDSYPWWPWSLFEEWLTGRRLRSAEDLRFWRPDRHSPWPLRMRPDSTLAGIDTRVHVKIARGTNGAGEPLPTRTASEGDLFATQRLYLSDVVDVEALVWVTGDKGLCCDTWLTLGGERGAAQLRAVDHAPPAMPDGLERSIAETGTFALYLLTPALFDQGWLPGWLRAREGAVLGELRDGDGRSTEVPVRLVAAVVRRAQPVSGLSLEAGARGRERSARRAVPAGSVYFFEVVEQSQRPRLVQGLKELWWSNLSDTPDDRAKGYGLAAFGVGLEVAGATPAGGGEVQ